MLACLLCHHPPKKTSTHRAVHGRSGTEGSRWQRRGERAAAPARVMLVISLMGRRRKGGGSEASAPWVSREDP